MSKALRIAFLALTVPGLMAASCDGPSPTPPPATPTGLAAQPGDEVVTLSWDANAEGDLLRYNVYRGSVSGALDKIADVEAGNETYTDTDVVNGTTYHYAIDAENDRGVRSSTSEEVSATPTTAGEAGIWDESRWDEVTWGP